MDRHSTGTQDIENEPNRDIHQPVVRELQALLDRRPDLAEALHESVSKACYGGVSTVEHYFDFLDKLVVWVPVEQRMLDKMREFHWYICNSHQDILNTDPEFVLWTVRFCQSWGQFLDTPASTRALETFLSHREYHMSDFIPNPSGWRSFNQWFAREVKPGKRPIVGLCDDAVVVSPADAVHMGQWPICPDATVRVKGTTLSIGQLLGDSPWAKDFGNGTFTHSFLELNDYHRFHVPVRGRILEARNIPGRVFLEVFKKPDGTLDDIDGTGYQFTQDRGLIVMDSPAVGKVALVAIGMGHVSSVVLVADPGTDLHKGEVCGYFVFGASDVVTLFAGNHVHVTAQKGKHYRQGEQIAVSL